MHKFVLEQLFKKPKNFSRAEKFEYERPRKKIYYHADKLLYLRIFKEVRKKLRKGNQFDVAMKIKSIFKEANKYGTFDYLSKYEFKYNFETMQNEQIPLTTEELVLKKTNQLKLRKIFLKEIGLTIKTMNYLYGYSSFSDLEAYYANATPEAIVQMKKRLLKKLN